MKRSAIGQEERVGRRRNVIGRDTKETNEKNRKT